MSVTRKVAIGCDHVAVEAKQMIIDYLHKECKGFEVQDLGTNSSAVVDYPDYAKQVAELVVKGEVEKGILVCGTGIGMSIAANKVPGIRAGLCHDHFTAHMTRAHNDANILCIGAWTTGPAIIKEIVQTFFATSYEGGENVARLEKMTAMETSH